LAWQQQQQQQQHSSNGAGASALVFNAGAAHLQSSGSGGQDTHFTPWRLLCRREEKEPEIYERQRAARGK
jgi:hypothetical protein